MIGKRGVFKDLCAVYAQICAFYAQICAFMRGIAHLLNIPAKGVILNKYNWFLKWLSLIIIMHLENTTNVERQHEWA